MFEHRMLAPSPRSKRSGLLSVPRHIQQNPVHLIVDFNKPLLLNRKSYSRKSRNADPRKPRTSRSAELSVLRGDRKPRWHKKSPDPVRSGQFSDAY
jgi:hypothetical protein